jgi:predicted O-methyltransferase YrrM
MATDRQSLRRQIVDLGTRVANAARERRPRRSAGSNEEPVRTRFPIGHYYSPAPDPRDLAAEPRRSQIWPPTPRETVGIDWRDAEQVELCRQVFARQERLAFAAEETGDPTVYFTSNDQYPALDAWLLEGMLRHLRPSRMIEVGSGYSTLVTARVNREHLDGRMRFTCIEPYPREFLTQGVPGVTDLRVEKVQDTPLEVFDDLGDGDVLFIDTSHTVKTGGDVPWLFGEVLPRLRPGAVAHVHDVFLPGDYPQPWVLDGWGWNEVYLVRAFLAFNDEFEILAGAQYLHQRHRDLLLEAFPGLPPEEHRSGGALWLRRRQPGRTATRPV